MDLYPSYSQTIRNKNKAPPPSLPCSRMSSPVNHLNINTPTQIHQLSQASPHQNHASSSSTPILARQALDTQSNILLCDPDGRGTERIGDVILAVRELDIQADRIISISLGMLAEASDSEIIRRNTSFWLRAHNGYHKFENVFYGMKREMSQLCTMDS